MKLKRFSAYSQGRHCFNPFRFSEAHFYGKYGYAYFDNEENAANSRQVLRAETNLVVSFAKSAPKPVSVDSTAPTLLGLADVLMEPQAPIPRFSVIVKKPTDLSSIEKAFNRTSLDKFDPTPGAGRPPTAPRVSMPFGNDLAPQYSADNQKISQEIFQTLAFGYDWRGGSIGGLVTVTDKRPPFSLENFRAREQRALERAPGHANDAATTTILGGGNSWNPFGGAYEKDKS